MSDDKKQPAAAAATKGDQVAELKRAKRESVKSLGDAKPVAIPAGQLRALGAPIPAEVPDGRPVKITAGELRKLAN